MQSMHPYLHFAGNAEPAMRYYKKVLGGEFVTLSRYKDIPGGEKMPAAEAEKFIHIDLALTNGQHIMATDMPGSHGEIVQGNNYHLCVNTESEAETEKLFNELSEGGKIDMPLNKTFWGAYFGMLRDKFGVQWMINYLAAN